MLLGIDIGTTHSKVGLFRADGSLLAYASHDTPAALDAAGQPVIDPEALWRVVRRGIGQVTQGGERVQAVGVAGMAESGLLLDRASGQPRTPILPWHGQQGSAHVATLRAAAPPTERFAVSGIRPTYKASLTKILGLREPDPAALDGAVWLSAPDYVVYRLTGALVTDHSLAGRTYAFDIHGRRWDAGWLAALGLTADLFPDALPAGTPFAARDDCLPPGTPVSVAGHDHVCAAFAAGVIQPDHVLDSMGTAETLVGTWAAPRALTADDFASGLLFGCHVIPERHYWMGSLSASGGSIEWLRGLLDGLLTYTDVEALAAPVDTPTGILYFPYLSGSSRRPGDRAAFVGLRRDHGRAHLLKAALEGTAYEMETLRATAASALGVTAGRVTVVGGGTRSPVWLQVKADVSGVAHHIHPTAEAALLGAALVAGLGSGVYTSADEAAAAVRLDDALAAVRPRPDAHARYQRLYRDGYLPLLDTLRAAYARLDDFDFLIS
jgi:xylulokinase